MWSKWQQHRVLQFWSGQSSHHQCSCLHNYQTWNCHPAAPEFPEYTHPGCHSEGLRRPSNACDEPSWFRKWVHLVEVTGYLPGLWHCWAGSCCQAIQGWWRCRGHLQAPQTPSLECHPQWDISSSFYQQLLGSEKHLHRSPWHPWVFDLRKLWYV